jgi:glycosyltransferase involved in cell wall biosynthesis
LRNHKLIYASSPDRGLDILLKMWPDIRAKFPDAELHVAYGWKVFDMVTGNNPERQEWKADVMQLMQQPGITDHSRVGKKELHELRLQCGIWAYPTYFAEISCINALEMQRDGVIPVTMSYGALKETVGSGVKVNGDIYDQLTQEKYLEALLDVMGWEDPEFERQRARDFAKNYDWPLIAKQWTPLFNEQKQDIKVSIVTPTIRKGFWNIMGNNIASQTYQNIEWIIVDDFEKNRQYEANKYAKKYKLDVKYLRGKDRARKRTYGLVNANNTALENATGELMIILQDFVLMPQDGVEQLVNLYRKNPDALLAPVDMYVAPKVKPNIEQEDWFSGNLDVIGNFIRQNIRIQKKGLRFTDNPYDFEQNYGAIPVKVAKDLGGWYEFYDEGLGYDNTDIALRALLSGYKILIDETNVGICIDHWEALSGTRENVIGRARKLNDPRYVWATEMLDREKLPLTRTQELDDKIELLYDIPDSVEDKDVVKWVKEHCPQIVQEWLEEVRV